MWETTALPRTVFPSVLAQKERVKGERERVADEADERMRERVEKRSHPREQQPADWPFYRADRSRLYEESHNRNLLSSLTFPCPPALLSASHPGSSFFHIKCTPLLLSLSFFLYFSPRVLYILLRDRESSSTKPFDRTAIGKPRGRGVERINAD